LQPLLRWSAESLRGFPFVLSNVYSCISLQSDSHRPGDNHQVGLAWTGTDHLGAKMNPGQRQGAVIG
jgi:hypothetical protein